MRDGGTGRGGRYSRVGLLHMSVRLWMIAGRKAYSGSQCQAETPPHLQDELGTPDQKQYLGGCHEVVRHVGPVRRRFLMLREAWVEGLSGPFWRTFPQW